MAAEVIPPGQPVRQFSVFLENKVGALMRLVMLLNASHVSVLGLSVLETTDVTIVRLVVTDPDVVEQVFFERGIPFSACTLIVVELADGPAGLGRCLQSLLEAETNLLFAYPLLTHPGGRPALAFRVEDTAFGMSALVAAGFKLLFQEDLSR
jgi:hypothetical protein